jgi:hypothetical protein
MNNLCTHGGETQDCILNKSDLINPHDKFQRLKHVGKEICFQLLYTKSTLQDKQYCIQEVI